MITPSSFVIDGDQLIQLTSDVSPIWSADCGTLYTDPLGQDAYNGIDSIQTVYLRPFNRTMQGTVYASGETADATIYGVFPSVPHYPMEIESDMFGVVASLSRSGKMRGRIEGDGFLMRTYKLVFSNRTPEEISELEAFINFHYPNIEFKHRDKWFGDVRMCRMESKLKTKVSSRVRGASECVITQVPYNILPTYANVVTDDISPSTPSGFTVNATSPTTIEVAWNAASDNVGVDHYILERDGINTNVGLELGYSDTVVAGSSHSYRVMAVDRDGNEGDWTVIKKVKTMPADNRAPSVTITTPLHLNGYWDTINMEVSVSDETALAGVQWLIDGANWGSELTSAPYSSSVPSYYYSEGYHDVTAIARDTSNNTSTSTVRVFFAGTADTTKPTATLDPFPNPSYSGNVSIVCRADDNVGLSYVNFQYYNGTSWINISDIFAGSDPMNTPFVATWDSTAVPNGTYTVASTPIDTSGNAGNAVYRTITIQN